MSNKWKPRNKYEVAPGLFVGSEIGDINREIKGYIKKFVDGDKTVLPKINELTNRKIELMKSKTFRKLLK